VPRPGQFELRTERLGPLPIVSHFLERLRLEEIFHRFVPTDDLRYLLGHEKALGVLLR
jgi:hypothetical protein